MSNNENNEVEQKEKNKCKKECKRFLIIALMAFLGSFLAFYVLMHQTMMHCFSPIKHDFSKFEHNMIKDFDNDVNKAEKLSKREFKHLKNKISAIHSAKYEDAYIIVVDLKQFNNDENNIRFNVNGNIVTVSGNVVKDKRNSESSYYFTESFEIPEKIKMNEITKEKVGNKYIITLPFED